MRFDRITQISTYIDQRGAYGRVRVAAGLSLNERACFSLRDVRLFDSTLCSENYIN